MPTADDADELTRLRRELATARAEQAATASILRAIASGPADAHAIFQAIVDGAASLSQADNVGIDRIVGDEFERVANLRTDAGPVEIGTRFPINRGSIGGQAVLEHRTIRSDDLQAVLAVSYPEIDECETTAESVWAAKCIDLEASSRFPSWVNAARSGP